MVICKECNIEFSPKDNSQQFCSRSCSARYNNKRRTLSEETKQKIKESIHKKLESKGLIVGKRKKGNTRKIINGIPINTCKVCGITWEEHTLKFLCDTCRKFKKDDKYNKYFKIKNSCCIVCGSPSRNKYCSQLCSAEHMKRQTSEKIKLGIYKSSNLTQWKRYLIETRGHKCEICNGVEWMGDRIPLVIDHINGRSSDNRLDNFRLVCGNCDMQLPTYKSKNKNSDRTKRKGQW